MGTHDFRRLSLAHDARTDTVRTVTRADVVSPPRDARDSRVLQLVFEGNAFLYNMVRILVGTLIRRRARQPPRGHRRPRAGVRAPGDAGMTAPAVGLTLEDVELDLPSGTGDPWPP